MHKLLLGTQSLFSFLDDLYERLMPGEEKGQVRQNAGYFVIGGHDVAFPHLFQSQRGLQPITGWCHFSLHLTLIPKPHRGNLLLMEVESL